VIETFGPPYQGPAIEPVRVWGTRRLLVLARLLPLAESFDVHLLGTGLPHFWVANMGEMRLTLGLSGWTTNDWTRGSALDMLAPPVSPPRDLIASVATMLRSVRAATVAQIQTHTHSDDAHTLAALRHLAWTGQVIHDLTAGVYRWRQVMPQPLGEAEMGTEHEEMTGLRQLLIKRKGGIKSREPAPGGGTLVTGTVDGSPVEVLTDADNRIRRGRCVCGYFRKFGVRNGPCRHMMTLRYWDSRLSGAEPSLAPPPLPKAWADQYKGGT
jgi:hypothetical protein